MIKIFLKFFLEALTGMTPPGILFDLNLATRFQPLDSRMQCFFKIAARSPAKEFGKRLPVSHPALG
jgi:hypothetical protein